MTARAILITGATGKQGGALIHALLRAKAPFEILALTRNTQSSSAQKLLQKSATIKLVTGNLDAIDDVFKKAKEAANAPIWGVFSVQSPVGGGQNAESEERQGKALVDAALKNGVKTFVYSSVDRGGSRSDNDPTNVPHFISKHKIEQHLFEKSKGTDMSCTVLRPVAFLENMAPGFIGKVFNTTWKTVLRKDQKLQFIATSDIGFFAAEAFLKPDEYSGKKISLAGDELTFDQYKDIWESHTGERIPTTFTLIAVILNWMVKELGSMFRWFRDVGYGADIPTLKTMNPDLKDFKTWLETESSWKR